jgi:hypothetical protein
MLNTVQLNYKLGMDIPYPYLAMPIKFRALVLYNQKKARLFNLRLVKAKIHRYTPHRALPLP